MKVQVKVTKTVKEEKEITLPYFFKITYSHIKPTYMAIFSEDKAMRIDRNSICCTESPAVTQFLNDENAVECSEKEFTEAYEILIDALMTFMPQQV